MARECSDCGGPYYRRDKVEIWDRREKGKFHKTTLAKCHKCSTLRKARQILLIAISRPIADPHRRRG